MHSACPRSAALCVSVLITGCLFGQIFEGRILEDHTGNALASARIRIHHAGTTGLVADLETESNGRFRTPELPPGEYRIDISKPSYADTALHVQLPAGPILVRLVRFGAITGRVTNAQGRPAHGATIFPMVQSSGGLFRKASPSGAVQADDRGQYRLYNLPPGRYAVGASWASLKPGSPSGAFLYPNNTRPVVFSIAGGEEYRGVDVVLPPHDGHSISGRVQLPAQGIRCSIALVSVDQPALAAAIAQANPDGTFRLDGIPSGSYQLLASAPAVGFSSRSVVLGAEPLFGSNSIEVAGQSVNGLVISLDKGRTVQFQLHTAASETPGTCPSGVTLTLSPLENWAALLYRTVPITSPREKTVEGLAPGRYDVTVKQPGGTCFGVPQILDLRTTPDSISVPILVTAAGSIRGRLSTGAAKPQDFVVVLLPSSSIDGQDKVRIGLPTAQSDFNFSKLRPGRYRIAVRPAAEASTMRWVLDLDRMTEIEVLSGGPTEVELTLPVREDR